MAPDSPEARRAMTQRHNELQGELDDGCCWPNYDEAKQAHADRGELLAALAQAEQDVEAHAAHNRELMHKLADVQEDREQTDIFLGKLQGVIDGTGSTGHIHFSLKPAQDLQAQLAEARAEIARLKGLLEGDVAESLYQATRAKKAEAEIARLTAEREALARLVEQWRREADESSASADADTMNRHNTTHARGMAQAFTVCADELAAALQAGAQEKP